MGIQLLKNALFLCIKEENRQRVFTSPPDYSLKAYNTVSISKFFWYFQWPQKSNRQLMKWNSPPFLQSACRSIHERNKVSASFAVFRWVLRSLDVAPHTQYYAKQPLQPILLCKKHACLEIVLFAQNVRYACPTHWEWKGRPIQSGWVHQIIPFRSPYCAAHPVRLWMTNNIFPYFHKFCRGCICLFFF